MKSYFQWNSSFTCQNVGTVNTSIEIEYQNYPGNKYTHANNLVPGETVEVYQPGETFLPNGYQGGATIRALAGGASIACIVNFTNARWTNPATAGDWSTSYNAFGH
jgi:hypothetical protein